MKFYHLSVLLLPQQQGVINAAPSGFRSATGVAKNGAEPSSVSSSNNNNVQHGRRQLQTKSLTTVYFAECEGDCDTDNDCNVGLKCFQRDGIETVPGCDGDGDSGVDYCYVPVYGELFEAGNNGSPESVFPLAFCHGDCDNDGECGEGLVCHYRDGTNADEPMDGYGCIGTPDSGTDYCIIAPTPSPVTPAPVTPAPVTPSPVETPAPVTPSPVTPAPVTPSPVTPSPVTPAPVSPSPVSPSPVTPSPVTPAPVDETASLPFLDEVGNNGVRGDGIFPLGECQGDCDSDWDCQWGMICFKRDEFESVPGCQSDGPNDNEGTDYCYYPISEKELTLMGDEDLPADNFPLGECQGDCDDDVDCGFGLNCFQRSGYTTVPGCDGDGSSSADYCYIPPAGELVLVGNDDEPSSAYPLQECQGDCDSDSDCDWGLTCFQRDGEESIEGCTGAGSDGWDYCYTPPAGTLVLVGNNNDPAEAFPLQACQGDCDSDSDCEYGLICIERNGDEPEVKTVFGCIGELQSTEDYCVVAPAGYLVLMGNNNSPADAFPLGECEGDCDSDSECAGDLICAQRSGYEAVAGCIGDGKRGSDYCYDPANDGPTPSPTEPPTPPPGTVTYIPGDATIQENGLILSTGLTSRRIATKDQPVQYANGGQSTEDFHSAPDGAAVFENPDGSGGWAYVSNSESSSNGGVGAIYFNADGEVTGYQRLLTGTKRNCGGGKTYWGTWLTCEEHDFGQVWEVDPWDPALSRETQMGGAGMDYESAAYDNRDINNPIFFITVDTGNGPLVRYTPSPQAVIDADVNGNNPDYSNLLHDTYGQQTFKYWVIDTISTTDKSAPIATGTYSWSDSLTDGQVSANDEYRNGEGIDIRDGILYFTTKTDKFLFTIDLDNGTFTRTRTESGAFDNQPDQVARVLDFSSGGTGATDDILYFCEDGGSDCGVHGRDASGNFFTILGNDGSFSGETSGLAFSPDGKYMYVSFQSPGYIYEIRRLDGFPFHGAKLDIKYHAEEDFVISRMLAGETNDQENMKTCSTNPSICMADGTQI